MMKRNDNELTCAGVFERVIAKRIREQAAQAEAIGVVFQFELTGDGGGHWIVDLSVADGRVAPGTHGDPAVTIEMPAADFLAMVRGELSPGTAQLRRVIRIGGDPTLAFWLEQLLEVPREANRVALEDALVPRRNGSDRFTRRPFGGSLVAGTHVEASHGRAQR